MHRGRRRTRSVCERCDALLPGGAGAACRPCRPERGLGRAGEEGSGQGGGRCGGGRGAAARGRAGKLASVRAQRVGAARPAVQLARGVRHNRRGAGGGASGRGVPLSRAGGRRAAPRLARRGPGRAQRGAHRHARPGARRDRPASVHPAPLCGRRRARLVVWAGGRARRGCVGRVAREGRPRRRHGAGRRGRRVWARGRRGAPRGGSPGRPGGCAAVRSGGSRVCHQRGAPRPRACGRCLHGQGCCRGRRAVCYAARDQRRGGLRGRLAARRRPDGHAHGRRGGRRVF